MEEKMCLGALNALQEFQIEELDNLLGGGGMVSIQFQLNVVGIVYRQFLLVVNMFRSKEYESKRTVI
ncbi:type A2 lanthipeptide [Streptococcus pyogenes]|uniref:type A2 lanthipeptide n=1 Tax=Streptococcus pyogenes TaxID=1314 RepID=UPI0010D545B2|nr:Type-A lantibiotic [Streptococcus pyogenes]